MIRQGHGAIYGMEELAPESKGTGVIILADKPETVARFFVPRILRNNKNNVQIAWLTNTKAAWRFMTAGFRKGRMI